MGKKIIHHNSSHSNIITNSKVKKNVHQIQNANKEKNETDSNILYFHELLTSIHELTEEVKELKEQIKNKNS
ncbi:hypothetical protein ACE193_21765 [Bernardetia sp. OM2101]|uniref:hypothetical protein n=1 Tax=Bernardetia sp. OM2101 TaxID=3344876 RepID=UPI0035D02D2D